MKYIKIIYFILIIIAVAIIPPVLINCLMSLPIKTYEQLKAPDWLSFWGSYLGGLLGSVAALIALRETRRQSDLQQVENDKNRRLSVMPALSLSCRKQAQNEKVDSFFILDHSQEQLSHFFEKSQKKYNEFLLSHSNDFHITAILCITNYGLGPAFSVKLSYYNEYNNETVTLNGLKVGQTNPYAIAVVLKDLHESSYTFNISFTDILGNNYTQSQKMILSNRELFFSATEYPSKI